MEELDNTKIVSKIKKLMAIANDPSASDQEIQLSTYKARKLMIEHKIKEFDLYGDTQDEKAIRVELDNKGDGYIYWALEKLSKNFRCRVSYIGRFNSTCQFALFGLEKDIKLCKPIAEMLIYYLDNRIKDIKQCYIGFEDFRIWKRSYFNGFACGIDISLKRAFIDMKVDEKYEIAIVGVPAVVEEFYSKKINTKTSRFVSSSKDGYVLGKKHGSNYDINKQNLLKNE